jgi:cytochrome c biogenesis protein ResB
MLAAKTSMMTRGKRFFLSRSTVLTLIVLVLAAVTVGALVPQAFITEKPQLDTWHSSHPTLAPLAELLGLFHIYTTPGFALLLLLVCISLGLSTIEQGKSARRRTFNAPPPTEAVGSYQLSLTTAAGILRKSGYRQLSATAHRFVKHPWGYWGAFSLHLGMLVCIAASLLITVTQQRGSIELLQDETHLPGAPWLSEEVGLLAGTLILPEPIRFDRLKLSYSRDSVHSVESDISFGNDPSSGSAAKTAINAPLYRNGLTIYQGNEYGQSFLVTIDPQSSNQPPAAYSIRFPARLGEAGYNEFKMPGDTRLLQVKYFPFAKGKPLKNEEMPLTLRLVENGKESARLTLRQGESGMLGGKEVRLLEVRDWTRLIFVRLYGIEGVFAGFLLIVLGAALIYCLPPREAWLEENEGQIILSWRSARFAKLYREELEILTDSMEKER